MIFFVFGRSWPKKAKENQRILSNWSPGISAIVPGISGIFPGISAIVLE